MEHSLRFLQLLEQCWGRVSQKLVPQRRDSSPKNRALIGPQQIVAEHKGYEFKKRQGFRWKFPDRRKILAQLPTQLPTIVQRTVVDWIATGREKLTVSPQCSR